MKAGIYSPYLDTLGGGERYVGSIAKVLSENGWDVDLESKDSDILKKIEARFDWKPLNVNIVPDIKKGNGYDLCFWLSDGSIPTLSGRINILHFQRPFYKVDGKSLLSRMKFFRIDKVVVNSKFTKAWIDKEYPCQSVVLYPPVDVKKFKMGKKENLIIYIGRFSQLEQSKRQDILIRVFKRFYNSGMRDWKLTLAGGSEVGRTEFVDNLRKSAKDYPIKIIEKPSFDEIKDLYSSAKFFWSAAGYGVNESKNPEKVEHFGITLVEAMASGCIPVAFNAGGHKEIIAQGENGFLWNSIGQLLTKTKKLITNKGMAKHISVNARKSSQNYSYERFEKELLSLL